MAGGGAPGEVTGIAHVIMTGAGATIVVVSLASIVM